MRKSGVIFLLLVYLFTNTEMHQLLRLPVLFDHYHEHKVMRPDISFIEYFSLHYLSGNDHDHNHEELPFRHKHCEAVHSVFALVPGVMPSEFTVHPLTRALWASYERQFHCVSVPGAIWQPPRYPVLRSC